MKEPNLIIENLKAIPEECTASEDAVSYVNSEDAETLKAAIEALEKQEQDRWIPVTERLPEDGQLIMAVEKSFEAGFYITRYSDTYHFTFPAWRPLPEAYKTEEEA